MTTNFAAGKNGCEGDGVKAMSDGDYGDRRPTFKPPPVGADPQPVIAEEWGTRGHDAVMRIPVAVRFVLGMTRMSVAKLMSVTRGSIIPLDRKVGDLVDIVVNDRIVARGEVVVLDEEPPRFAISVREVVQATDD